MELFDLDVKVRETNGSRASRKLRLYGQIPGVLYGQDRPPLSVSLEGSALDKLLRDGHRLVTLKMGSDEQRAIITEVQHDHYGDDIIHVDFSRIRMGQAMNFSVPVTLTGLSEGVKLGGILEQKKDSIEVIGLPENLPEFLEVSVVNVGLGESLHFEDIPLPEGLELAHENEKRAILVSVSVPGGLEEETPEDEEDSSDGQPEIIKKGKEDEE